MAVDIFYKDLNCCAIISSRLNSAYKMDKNSDHLGLIFAMRGRLLKH